MVADGISWSVHLWYACTYGCYATQKWRSAIRLFGKTNAYWWPKIVQRGEEQSLFASFCSKTTFPGPSLHLSECVYTFATNSVFIVKDNSKYLHTFTSWMFISLNKWGTTFTIKSPDQTITKNITTRQGTLIAQNSFSWYPSCMQIPMFWAIISTSWVTFTNNGRAIHIIVVVAFHVLTNTLRYLFTRTLLWHGLGTTSGKSPWFLFPFTPYT